MNVSGTTREGGTVTLERLNCTYLVPPDHPAPETLRGRMDAVLRQQLAPICGRVLEQTLDSEDPSLWFVRRLNVDLALNTGLVDDDQVARTWGHSMATSIVRTIATGADGEEVLHFADRAAYVACFINDLAEGRAWGRWYYNLFDALRSLPLGAAIREALAREPEPAAVLLQLDREVRLERVLSVLSDTEAQRVYEACVPAGTDSEVGSRRLIDALLAIWPTASLNAQGTNGHNALRLYVAMLRGASHLATDSNLPAAIKHLLGFAGLIREVSSRDLLLKDLASGDVRAALGLARRDGVTAALETLPFFQQAADGDADWLHALARVVAPATIPHDGKAKQSGSQTFITAFGGLFLLLPSLLELGLHDLIEAAPYPKLEGMSKAQALRCLLALKCVGRPRLHEALNDPALALAAGLDNSPSLEMLQEIGEAATSAMDHVCQRSLVEELSRRSRIEGRYLTADIVTAPFSGEQIVLLRDAGHDMWLFAAPLDNTANIEEILSASLTSVQQATEAPVEYLLVGPGLNGWLATDALADQKIQLLWMESIGSSANVAAILKQLHLGESTDGQAITVWTAEPRSVPDAVSALFARFMMRSKPIAYELAYLSLNDLTLPAAADVHWSTSFDMTWSLTARAVLNSFAVRLPGFDWSSSEYLYQNFLSGTSGVRIADDRIEVLLPTSPLRLILRMAGVDGQTYAVPWLDDVQVTLMIPAG